LQGFAFALQVTTQIPKLAVLGVHADPLVAFVIPLLEDIVEVGEQLLQRALRILAS
jgi:hypothetical protein